MSLSLVITNAGRAALVNAANTGTNTVLVTQIGVSATAVTANPTMTALAGEIKRLATFGGVAVADDTLHMTIRDETASVYSLRSFALYLSNGVLFGLFGQASPIMEKTVNSTLLLSVDIKLADIAAPTITFGSTEFLNPPATTEVQGVIELATDPEVAGKTDATRAVTAKSLWFAFSTWLAAWGSDVWRSSNDGSGSGLDSDLLDGQQGAWYSNIAARLGFTPANKAGDTFTGPIRRDELAYLDIQGGNPILNFDAADYIYFSRATNVLYFIIGGAARASLDPSGVFSSAGQMGAAGQIVWNAGNDGAGSGMDADLFHGRPPSAYTRNDGTPNAARSQGQISAGDTPNEGFHSAPIQIREIGYVGTATRSTAYAPSIAFHWAGVNAAHLKMYEDGSLRARGNNNDPASYVPFYAANVYSHSQIVWSAGNDGAGSGLDSDLLDGQQGGWYADIPGRLGFVPVRQGGGSGQGPNIVHIGWSGSRLKAQVDSSDLGSIVFDPHIADVWRASNDGAGSGMDTDLFRGNPLEAFALLNQFDFNANPVGHFQMPGGFVVNWGTSGVLNGDQPATINLSKPVSLHLAAVCVPNGSNANVDNHGIMVNQPIGQPATSLTVGRGFITGGGGTSGTVTFIAIGKV
ncbi:hypothetical protein [Asticcacaulis machinosus]|uniref:Uncharacterized protein n=1 Tax=Asticcacaulis machinosus TaxID=2984211 RepID=A0ABT5HHA2_9CAUL|nr:hypothetical protein [Asticcacaulis machinosus]MDC7675383.1 hypothetical protein [Asticcacaulis machinosus]